MSESFSVSNGVCQGCVLSPILFTVYMNDLLMGLKKSGIGCHWSSSYSGAVCYADDLVVLAPSLSALRFLLVNYESFASDRGLTFNPLKMQLVCFGRTQSSSCSGFVRFCGTRLSFSDSACHLGNILRYDLSDTSDIMSN